VTLDKFSKKNSHCYVIKRKCAQENAFFACLHSFGVLQFKLCHYVILKKKKKTLKLNWCISTLAQKSWCIEKSLISLESFVVYDAYINTSVNDTNNTDSSNMHVDTSCDTIYLFKHFFL